MVTLVRFGEEHFEATRRWLANSTRLCEQIDCLSVPSQSGNQAYWHANLKDETREDYAILAAAGHIGNCGLNEIDRKRKKAQLWIYLGGREGGGIGGKAIRALLARAFDELALERVYIRVLVTNPRAYGFYKTLGFVDEGRLRHDTVHNNDYVDSFLLSMLSGEYKTSRLGHTGNTP